MNALKHGFSSQEIVVEGEDADEFDALRIQLTTEFAPDSIIERELVDRLAGLLWRLRRVPLFEAALIRARRGAITDPPGYHIYRNRDETTYISDEGMKNAKAFVESIHARAQQEAQQKLGAPLAIERGTTKINESSHGAAASPLMEATQSEPSRTTDEEITDSQAARIKRDHPDQLSSRATSLALIKDSEDHDTLSKLSRYEAGLMNAITKTLSLMQAIQNSGLLPKK